MGNCTSIDKKRVEENTTTANDQYHRAHHPPPQPGGGTGGGSNNNSNGGGSSSNNAGSKPPPDTLWSPGPGHRPAVPEGDPLGTSSIFIFPQAMKEEVKEQWKIFNELDNKDEADMMALASFFQTVCATATAKENLFPASEESLLPKDFASVENIQVQNVGRLDSNIYNLDEFEIPAKGKITMDTVLDIIDCFRRGGKLHVHSVQKILKGVYWLFKKFPNIREANVSDPDQNLIVCGDVHGQFFDLLYILDVNGVPSETNMYLFNGDFVDRGPNSVEVIITLFALQVAAPEYVFLNRGNHEDPAVCCIFGFMKECLDKYDDMTFSMFIEVFRYLPLATTINGQVLVLHGGLFGEPGVLLEDIMTANRKDYGFNPEDLEGDGKTNDADSSTDGSIMNNQETQAFLTQVVKDLLWSDPTPKTGVYPNPRGEGVLFGPDVTLQFLRENRLRMLIRSHECVPVGFQQPFEGGPYKSLLCTIFSASNYSASGNQGAFMKFATVQREGSYEVQSIAEVNSLVPPTQQEDRKLEKLFYTVHCYYMGDELGQEQCLERSLQASLVNVVLKRKTSLAANFEAADSNNNHTVTTEQWAQIMSDVTKLQVRWDLLTHLLVPEEGLEGGLVKYDAFLNNFQVQYGKNARDGESAAEQVFDALYVNKKQLEAIFNFYDKDGDGSISREEFLAGCQVINSMLPPEEQLQEPERILDLMDFNHNYSIEINEFFEAFRLLDCHDGKLDGTIDLHTEEYKKKAYFMAQKRRQSSRLFQSSSNVEETQGNSFSKRFSFREKRPNGA